MLDRIKRVIMQAEIPTCPYCQSKNNALSGKHANPRNGDIAICAECCHASVIKVNPIRLCKPKNRKEAKWCDGALEILKKDL